MTAATGFAASDLFQVLRDGKPRTRSELIDITGLSRTTIGSRIDSLVESGMVTALTESISTGGRPSARVAFNPQARVIAAADLGATHATVALTDLASQVIVEVHTAMEIAAGPQVVLDWLTTIISQLLVEAGRSSSELLAIGIGVPGPVEHTTGRPSNPPIMPGWDNYDIPGHVQRSYPVPVLVDNDVNIMALGERAMSWPAADHLMFLKVATGIGSGIISGGVLQRGAEGIAGDIGHISISRGAATVCRCGNTGCLEAVAGGPAIAAELRSEGIDASNGNDVVDLVRAGNVRALQIVRQAGRDIGEVLNMCVSIVNPSVIVVGGSLAQLGEQLIAGIREVVYARSMPLATRQLSIVQSQTGPESAVIGASLIAIEHALAPENMT